MLPVTCGVRGCFRMEVEKPLPKEDQLQRRDLGLHSHLSGLHFLACHLKD